MFGNQQVAFKFVITIHETLKNSQKTQTKIQEIPLPPIEVQQQIVDELEGYQKIIDGCRQVVENYKPTIDIENVKNSLKLTHSYPLILDLTMH